MGSALDGDDVEFSDTYTKGKCKEPLKCLYCSTATVFVIRSPQSA